MSTHSRLKTHYYRPVSAGFPPPAAPPAETCEAMVLLAGVVRPTEWHRAIQRPLLDLPVDQEQSLMDLWHAQAVGVARGFASDGLLLRVRLDPASPAPSRHHLRDRFVRIAIDRDTPPWRGSGGVLRDIARDYPDDARIVAVHAAQLPLQNLRAVVADLSRSGADASLVTCPHGGVCGNVMLLRCAALRDLPEIGYCDFHEQALPVIARRFTTRAMPSSSPVGLSVRSRADYLHALRRYHRLRQGLSSASPLAEDWKPAFSIVEAGADVHPSAHLLDSVVLRGARVRRDATLVRCVVCPGGTVSPGRTFVDQLIHAPQ